ncbi:MAG: Tail Collar domain protein [Phycisphaerales bacterium]|jgi:microcystin-dependent protein|nr:Tail Collar domain protein [Phycisphaerales bacterium]MDB5298842.1 Tail Collar domain protein [Phycisphaerales bacterium]
MSDPFVGEIRMVGFNFAPRGWAFCNGQILNISQNTALFSLLGTMYGGNGVTNFALPNLQGQAAMHFGQGPGLSSRSLGESGGEAAVALISQQLPGHNHNANADALSGGSAPPSGQWGTSPTMRVYGSGAPNVAMNAASLSATGGSQPHNNWPPYLAVNFVIALQGIFPARS